MAWRESAHEAVHELEFFVRHHQAAERDQFILAGHAVDIDAQTIAVRATGNRCRREICRVRDASNQACRPERLACRPDQDIGDRAPTARMASLAA